MSQAWSPAQFDIFELEGRPDPIICSESVKKILAQIEQISDSNAPVLITGETGTGKELIARAVHLASVRRRQPLATFNCAAIAKELAESLLFGHRRGSFTGADKDHPGVIRDANGATLFLDEIGEMDPGLQAKLLRFLQEGEIHPLGEARPVKVDVRVVAATNRDLAAETAAGHFRADLFHRLNVFHFHLPPLREEREHIESLIAYYFDRYRREANKPHIQLSREAVEVLRRYEWPGNARELCGELQRLAQFAEGEMIGANYLSQSIREWAEAGRADVEESSNIEDQVAIDSSLPLNQAVRMLERELITRALEKCGGNLTYAANALKLTRTGLRSKMRLLGVGKPPATS
ncbi:MAG: sigma-54 interaction domain-containing protein [Blastocatellia bacterium]